jgi:hypothetical protein
MYFLIISLLLILSCSKDNPNNNADNNLNSVNCSVSGDLNFNFKSSSASYIKYQTGQTMLFAEMHLSPNENYSLQIKFDDIDDKTNFDLYGSEPLTYFELQNMTTKVKTYSSNVTGNISFNYKSIDSLNGTFNFSASFIDSLHSLTKTINLTNGNFIINKIAE